MDQFVVGTALRAQDIAALRGAVRGVVLLDGEGEYDTARRVHNRLVDQRPGAIVQVATSADIAEVLRFARERGLSTSVRAGGHGVAGHAVAGDLVIDLSTLHGVQVDPVTRTAVVRAGSTWGEVDAATQAHGLAMPGGPVTTTGVAGLTLGGGQGWLSPQYGLTCDNLLSAELVTADGELVVASEESEPELFWALRGGGGNFGVVTSFTFRVQPLNPTVFGGLLLYSLADAHEVTQTVEELLTTHTTFAGAMVLLSAPPAPFVPGDLVGRPVVGVVPAWLGDPDQARPVLRPLWERLRPLADNTGPMPYVALQSIFEQPGAPATRQRWAGTLLPALPPRLIDSLLMATECMPSRPSHIAITRQGAAVGQVAEDATAFPHRAMEWAVQPAAAWMDPADDEPNLAWTKDLTGKLRADLHGTYLNTDGDGSADRTRWAFGPDRYARLQRVKTTWDPADVFHHCHHIPPA